MNLMRRAVLQVNASREPLRIISARQALKLITKGKAKVLVPTIIEVYPSIYLPSVIALTTYAKVPYKRPIPSRKNIFTRDGFKCLYCGAHGSKIVLELEHIVPKSRGGQGTWENVCASCHACNQKKRDRTPEEADMPLLHIPGRLTLHTSRYLLRLVGLEEDKRWAKYLYC